MNFLNPNNFTPAPYVLPSEISQAIAITSFRSTNTFILPITGDDWEPYWLVLMSIPIVFAIIWLAGVILAFLNFSCSCCGWAKTPKARVFGFVFFEINICLSVAMWIWGLTITIVPAETIDSATETFQIFSATLNTVSAFLGTLTSAAADTIVAGQEIIDNPSAFVCFPSQELPDLGTFINELENFTNVNENILSEIGELSRIVGDVDSTVETAMPYIDGVSLGITILGALLLFMSVFFAASVIIMFLGGPDSYDSARCVTFRSIFYIVLYSLGLIAVTGAMIIAIVFWPTSTIGADLCYPNPLNTIQRVGLQSFGDDSFASVTNECPNFINEPVGEFESDSDVFLRTICFYGTCENIPSVLSENALWANETIEDFLPIVAELLSLINQEPDPEDCENLVSSATQLRDEAEKLTPILLGTVGCDVINPAYSSIVYDDFCYTVVVDAIPVWKAYFIGSFSFFIAMVLFRLFSLSKPYGTRRMNSRKIVATLVEDMAENTTKSSKANETEDMENVDTENKNIRGLLSKGDSEYAV